MLRCRLPFFITALRLTSAPPEREELPSDFLLAVLVSAVISFAAALFTARVVSKRTLKELNDINLDDPNDSNFGSELSLLFYKIRSQNSQIQSSFESLNAVSRNLK